MSLHAASFRYAALLGVFGAALVLPVLSGWVGWTAAPPWPGPTQGIALWAGGVALLLAGMYLGKAAGAAPETALARLGPLTALLLVPYTTFGILVVLLNRLVSAEPMADRVAPRLWLGGTPLPLGRRRVAALGVDAVLNLCIEFPDLARLAPAGMAYCRVPLLDGAAPHPLQLDEAVRWAEEHYRQGRTVLVHCAQGHGRSATVATALLVRLGLHADPETAREAIRGIRPGIRLGPGQRAVVARYCSAEGAAGGSASPGA